MITWILEEDTFDEGLDPLIQAIKNNNMKYRMIRYYPFINEEYKDIRYKYFGEEYESHIFYGSFEIYKYTQNVLNNVVWRPDPIFAIDIGYNRKYNELSVVEINSFSCSGLYNCDPEPIVKK